MRSTSALKRSGFPECIYIFTERDKIIVHWFIVDDLFCIIQSLTTITLYPGSVGTSFSPNLRLGLLKCIQKLSIRSVIFCFI